MFLVMFILACGLLAGVGQFLKGCTSHAYDESYDPREEGQYERGWP